jgi:uncharacterized protein YegP (UPF0339 family)
MAGMFELFIDSDASFRFRLTAPDGTVMALSKPFPDKLAAVAGIAAVREYAGMGHVSEIPAPKADRQAAPQTVAARAPVAPAPVGAAPEKRRVRAGTSGTPVRLPRLRMPSAVPSVAARFLGGRARSRNQQMITHWRQNLEAGTSRSELRAC